MKLNMLLLIYGTLVLVSLSNAAMACWIMPDERSALEKRSDSDAVAVGRQCRTINIGVNDWDNLGPVQNLSNGRIAQIINERNSSVLVADCNTREVTIVHGPRTIVPELETSCGPHFDVADLAGPDAVMSLSEGGDLHELVKLVEGIGGRESNPIERFFEFTTWSSNAGKQTHEVGHKDRFNLLCGCNFYYRNSPGATQ